MSFAILVYFNKFWVDPMTQNIWDFLLYMLVVEHYVYLSPCDYQFRTTKFIEAKIDDFLYQWTVGSNMFGTFGCFAHPTSLVSLGMARLASLGE